MFHLGIVGHRYLGDRKTIEFVSQECRAILIRTLADHDEVIALSAIAEGADTLFAEAALALEVPLEIVRPFSDYASDFKSAAAKRRSVPTEPRAVRRSTQPRECTLRGCKLHIRESSGGGSIRREVVKSEF